MTDKKENSTSRGAAPTRHIGHEYQWYAVSVDFDFCRVGDDIIPFDSYA